MRILVTFAVDAEFAPWRRRHAFSSVSIPAPVGLHPHFIYRGTVFENDVDVLLTGIGWDESKAESWPSYALRELLKNRPDMCISSGLAGGLRADLRCGDVVAAKEVSLRRGGEPFRTSANLLTIAKDAGARIDLRQITEPNIVFEASAKSALSRFGDFVDMEGYHLLELVKSARVPVISVRAISDTCDMDLPREITDVVDREGHVQTMQLLKLILRRPGRVPTLVSFGAHSRDAANSLADFLDRFLEAVEGGDEWEAQAKREAVATQ